MRRRRSTQPPCSPDCVEANKGSPVSDVHGLEAEAGERWISVERSWDDRDGLVDPKSKAGTRLTRLCETLRTILAEHVPADRAQR